MGFYLIVRFNTEQYVNSEWDIIQFLSFPLFSAHYILNTFVLHTLLGWRVLFAVILHDMLLPLMSVQFCVQRRRKTRPSEQTCHIEHVMKVNRKCAASRRDTPVPLWSSRGSREVRSGPPERPAIWRNAEKQRVGSSLPASLSPSAKRPKEIHTNLLRKPCLATSLRCRLLVRVLR